MKLPENKNERIKILAMIGIGGVAVLYAILQLAVFPLMTSFKQNSLLLDEKREEQNKMKRELLKVDRTQAEFNSVESQVQAFSAHLVQPVLGTYLIGIQSSLEKYANKAGLSVNPASEIGFAEVPGKNKDGSKRSVKSYGVRLTGSGGYAQMLSFIRQLEESNPLLCISELSIISQASAPESHQINFSIEWPVLAETEKTADELPDPEASRRPAPSTTDDAL